MKLNARFLLVVVLMLGLMLASVGVYAQDDDMVSEFGAGEIELLFWNGLTGPDGETMVELVKAFAEENPDVSVRMERLNWTQQYFPKLLAGLAGGNPPDIFLMHEYEMTQFAQMGVLRDLSDLYSDNGGPIPIDDVSPAIIESLTRDGRIMGVPLDFHGYGEWHNCDLFDAAGVPCDSLATTRDEYLDLAQRLTLDENGNNAQSPDFDADNIVQWGTSIFWYRPGFLTALAQNSMSWADDMGQALLEDSGIIETMQWFQDLECVHNVAPPPAGFDRYRALSINMAIFNHGSWAWNFVSQNVENWMALPYPALGDDGNSAVWASAHVFYLPIQADGIRLEASKRFLAYMSDHGLDWAHSGMPPARISQIEGMDPEVYPSASTFGANLLVNGVFDRQHRNWLEIEAQYADAMARAFESECEISMSDVFADANARIQRILDRYN
jgi:ABC-type glycerol-3-phosphate transport system substrate-binding protein